MTETHRSYNRQAHNYEKRWHSYLTHTHDKFLSRVTVKEGDRLLDTSCGTGLLASELIENQLPFGSLHLNDISDNMIAIAKDRLPNKAHIHYSQLPADQLDQLNETFDQIFCLNAFHHYENQVKVVHNFYQLLRKGGRAVILDWNRVGLFRPINRIIKKAVPEIINTRSEKEMTLLLSDAGFRILKQESWAYRFWRFYFIEGVKPDQD
jgi:ubiquinone/menaquinone biosynthesis C-methylase UbiE